MSDIQIPYLILYLVSVFFASVSQVLLKKAALRPHDRVIEEYTDWRILVGYGIFIGCTLLTMIAYRGVPMNWGPVLESSGYIYITVFGVLIFKERLSVKKLTALGMIIGGILLYAL